MPKRTRSKDTGIHLNNEPALQSKKKNLASTENSFIETLRTVGYIIGDNSNANELDVDQAIFLRDLEKLLTSKGTCAQFLRGLENMLEDEVRLKWSLLPTATTPTCKNARNACQDSLLHLLLGIEPLQGRIVELLLEKLAEFSYTDTSELFDPVEGKSLACMILSQFRWLSKLVEGHDLAKKLLELIKATPVEVQCDILVLLPEVICELDHAEVANSLAEILLENQELNVAILDTLSSLVIDSETLSDIRKQVLKTLATADPKDLPGVIRFVLMNLRNDEMVEVISEIRDNLEFTPAFDPVLSSTPLIQQLGSAPGKSNSCLFIAAIKLSLRFQKQLCDSWIKVLDSVQSPDHYKSFDIIILFVLHSLVSHKKKVENLFRKKIKSGEIKEQLLNITFRCHNEVLKDYVSALLDLSQGLLKSADSVVSLYGCSIYVKSFIWFDTFTKQEIVGSLITHVGHGNFSEVNTALHTLLSLVKHHTAKMAPFGLFVKNLLDCFNDLTLVQIRKVYQMLSYLSFQGGREGSILEDDMHIIIRKQLMSCTLRYRKMGVIGALMAAKTACSKPEDESTGLIIDKMQMDKNLQIAVGLLELVKNSVINSPEAMALVYDELSRIISERQSMKPIEEWIDSHILADFEECYVIDSPESASEQFGGQAVIKFGLDDVNDPIALNLYGIMKQNIEEQNYNLDYDDNEASSSAIATTSKQLHSKDVDAVLVALLKLARTGKKGGATSSKPTVGSPLTLPSLFRLLRIRKLSQDNCLEAIDALLGCAILLPEVRHSKFPSLQEKEKHFILDAIFCLINWIRENINAFSTIDDKDTKTNVVLRLQLMIELQEMACKYIQATTNYVPLLANFDSEDTDMPQLKLAVKKHAKTKKRVLKGKKKVGKGSPEDTMSKTCDKSQTRVSDTDSDDNSVTVDDSSTITSVMNALRPYFRELDLEPFLLLELGVTFNKSCDVLCSEKERELSLTPIEVKFLLEDLLNKLRHCLLSSFRSRFKSSQQQVGYSNLEVHSTDHVIAFCIRLFPSFCKILDDCGNYFRYLTAESDGIIDSLVLLNDISQQISVCMQLIFKVMNTILSWKEFTLNDKITLLKTALRTIACHEETVTDQAPLQQMIALTIQYLVKFDDAIITLSSAAALTELLESVLKYSNGSESRKEVSDLAKQFLKKSWLELSKKKVKTSEANLSVQLMLEAFVKHSEDVLNSLEFLATETIPKLANDNENGDETAFNTLNKSSLSCYYKIMAASLSDEMKQFYVEKPKNKHEEILHWTRAVKIFQVLVNLIKTFDSRSIIRVSLKYGRQFIDTFLKHAMPLLDKLFCSKREEVLLLLKNLQMSTRYLQHVCSHSKVVKDISLTNQVPFLKKTLESFVYRVKVMLAVNKCEEAFWLGNLKNRDLKGTEILSQSLQGSDEEGVKESESDNESDQNSHAHSSDSESAEQQDESRDSSVSGEKTRKSFVMYKP